MFRYSIASAIFTLLASTVCRAEPATQPARTDTLITTSIVDAPAEEIFASFTTPEGLVKAWAVAKAKVDFRVGGEIRSTYSTDTDLDSPKAIRNTILAYVPNRILVIKPTPPDGSPAWLQAICESGWNVLELTPIGEQRTRVTLTGMGFTVGSPLHDKAYEFFKQGNEATFVKMQQNLGNPELKSQTERAWQKLKSRVGGNWISESTRPDGSIFRAHATYEPAMNGEFIVARGRLGDASGMHDHAMMIASIEPASGAIRFDQFLEGNKTAHGMFVTIDEDTIAQPLVFQSPGKPDSPVWAVIRFIDNDTYRFNVFASRAQAQSGGKPMVDVTYHRVSELPDQFKQTAVKK